MADRIFSQAWYRVSELKPRLRSHVQVHRHTYRDTAWYIIQDHASGQFTRLSTEAYRIVGQMDGEKNLQLIWEQACESLGDNMPTQDEVIQLVGQLHQSNILQLDLPPDIQELQRRYSKRKRQKFWQSLKSPLAIRIPLIDPENFLQRTYPMVRFVFSHWMWAAWILLLLTAVILAGMQWQPLTNNLADQILSTENLLILWWVYPLVKLIHEFGHAYAVKHWGGEVHEMGIMFLIFMPIPYVDASAASSLSDKRPRMLISSMGMITELALGALAMIVWTLVEPGMVRSIAYNVMLIAGVSTLLMNGNPLLRFDGYYIFADWLEIPNLGKRSNQYIAYLAQRYFLHMHDARSPVHAKGEAGWMAFYSIAAYFYRIFLAFTIAFFVATQFFLIGVILALWSLWTSLLMPLVKITKTLLTDSRFRASRQRAWSWISGLVAVLIILIFIVPMPSSLIAEGIVWVPKQVEVRTAANCNIDKVLVTPGIKVAANMPLIYCRSEEIETDVRELKAKLREYTARYDDKRISSRTEAQILQDEIIRIRGELTYVEEQFSSLTIKSPVAGIFLLNERVKDLHGRFTQRGTVLGYIVDPDNVGVRVVLRHSDVEHLRTTQKVIARLAENIKEDIPAVIKRTIPAASKKLPGLALSVEGGGEFALDPLSETGDEAFETLFHLDLSLPGGAYASNIGERVYVRFELNPEPVFRRIYRAVRRLFLSQFDV